MTIAVTSPAVSVGNGWIALLARVADLTDCDRVEALCREQLDEVKQTVPDRVDVQLISPSGDPSRQAGFLLSSPDPVLLSNWMSSPAATETMGALAEHSPTPVAIVAQGAGAPTTFPVSYVVTYNVAVNNRDRFQEWQPKIVAAHLEADGFVSAEYHPPYALEDNDWTVMIRFASDGHLNGWLDSDIRNELVGQLETIAEDLELHRAGLSWAGWFPQPASATRTQPRRWKQALATVLPLYPTVMLATIHLAPRLGAEGWGWPRWLATFVVVCTAVATLTWVLMPIVTSRLKPWLLPAPDQPVRHAVAWAALVIASIGGLLAVFGFTT